jgi:uncharacterized protein YdeI (BOF family)
MNRLITHFSLATLLTIGWLGCASDTQVATVPVVTAQPVSSPTITSQTISGEVIRNEGDAYIVRESSGRQTRVYLDRNSQTDSVVVGDPVVVRYNPTSGYATSIRRTASNLAPLPLGSVPPQPQTIEGVVQRLEGTDYVVKDLSGKEVRLNVDRNTRLDGNITAGDRIVALTNPTASQGAYVNNMYILGSPGVIQGEILRIEGNSYVIRDLTGRELRVESNASTIRNGNPMVGDRIIAYQGPASGIRADSIIRR